jgi:hypothetical protein
MYGLFDLYDTKTAVIEKTHDYDVIYSFQSYMISYESKVISFHRKIKERILAIRFEWMLDFYEM